MKKISGLKNYSWNQLQKWGLTRREQKNYRVCFFWHGSDGTFSHSPSWDWRGCSAAQNKPLYMSPKNYTHVKDKRKLKKMSKKYDRHSYHRTGVTNLWSGGHFSCLFPHFFFVFQLIQYIFLRIKELCWSFISYLYLTKTTFKKTKQNNVPQIFPSFIPNNWIHIHIFHSQ